MLIGKPYDAHVVNTLAIQEKLPKINRDSSKPSVLAHHNPVGMLYAAEGNIDVMLAGHTHAGQFFPGAALDASHILYSGFNTVWVQRPEPETTSGAHDRSESQARPESC